MTRFALHRAEWSACTRCELHEHRTAVCLFSRGSKLPCDVLFVGEAPGKCLSGDALIDTAFRDKRTRPDGIPIRDLVGKSGFQVYSYDLETKSLVLGTVKKVWRTGFRKLFKVSFEWWGPQPGGKGGRTKRYGSIRVTDNHPFLLRNGEYRSITEGLQPGDRLQPFYRFVSGRRYRVGLHSSKMVKEAVFLAGQKIGRDLVSGEEAHHDDRNPENDTAENLIVMTQEDHARLHALEDNAMFNHEHRETHRKAVRDEGYRAGQSERMSQHLSDPENRARRVAALHANRERSSATLKNRYATDPVFYFRYLKARKWPNGRTLSDDEIRTKMADKFPGEYYPPADDNHTVTSIQEVKPDSVYDMEVEKYHNFVANGVFVHNSENALGECFTGPAGHLLDRIIAAAFRGLTIRYAVTNLVGCIPLLDDKGKEMQPEPAHVKACRPRLQEVIDMAHPRLVVRVGAMARTWLEPGGKGDPVLPPGCEIADIDHPASILRAPTVQRNLAEQRCVVTIRNAVEDLK